MDFSLSEEQRLLRDTIRDFMRREVAPVIAGFDERQEFPREIYRALGALGVLGILVPEALGGSGLTHVDYVTVMEEISRVDGSTGLGVAAHNSLCTNHIYMFGDEEQRLRYLPRLCSGEWLGAWALTEPGCGSDAAAMASTAVRDGEDYVLNGTKNFITHGSVGGVCVVMAKTDVEAGHRGVSAFVVETGSEGYVVARKEDKMGWRSSDTAQIVLQDCRVPAHNRLGEEGEGFAQAMQVLAGGRVGIAALGLGLAQGALDEAVRYAGERKAFGKSIRDFQAVQFHVADMHVRCEASRLLCYRAACMRDRGMDTTCESSMSKLLASETAVTNASDGLQIHGGYGCIRDYPIERFYRDAKICTIGEGTSEILRLVIARQILRGTSLSRQDLLS